MYDLRITSATRILQIKLGLQKIAWQKYTMCKTYVHKGLPNMNKIDKVKNRDYCTQNATKGCDGQTAESQAGTSKSKFTNTKLLNPSLA